MYVYVYCTYTEGGGGIDAHESLWKAILIIMMVAVSSSTILIGGKKEDNMLVAV